MKIIKTILIMSGMLMINSAVAINQGELILTNTLNEPVAFKAIISKFGGTVQTRRGPITFEDKGKQIFIPSNDPNRWLPIAPTSSFTIGSPIQVPEDMGGGYIYGDDIKLTIIVVSKSKGKVFVVHEPKNYLIMLGDEEELILIDEDGNLVTT